MAKANPASALLGGGKKRKKKQGNAGGALLGPNFFKKPSGEFGSRNVTFSQNASGEFSATPNASGVGGAGVATRAAGLVDPVADQQVQAKKADTAIPLSVAQERSNVGMSKNIMSGLVGGAKAVGDLFGGFAKDAMNLGDLAGGAYDTLGLAATNAALPTSQDIQESGNIRLRPVAAGDPGSITVGGQRGGQLSIKGTDLTSKDPSTRALAETRTKSMRGLAIEAGETETNILVKGLHGGSVRFKIPAHIPQDLFEDQVEGYRTKGLSYNEATEQALEDARNVYGDEREPSGIELSVAGRLGNIRAGTEKGSTFAAGFGSPGTPGTGNVPLDFVLNERRREDAADEARRTGIIQTLPPRAGSGPLELAQQISQGPRGITPDMTEAQKAAIKMANATRPQSVTVGKRIEMKAAAAVRATADAAIKTAATRAEKKAISRQAKEAVKYIEKHGPIWNGLNKFIESFVEGETEGAGEKKTFIPGKGSPIEGRKYVGGELQRGNLTVAALADTWNAVTGNFGHVPEAVLSNAMAGLFARHSEWPQNVVHDFMREHKDIFAAHLKVPATPENTGGRAEGQPSPPETPGEQLTAEVAKQYMDFYGDKDTAREKARADGWVF